MKIWKKLLPVCLLLAVLLLISGCGADQTPYQVNDSQSYTLSVKFDANGGTFTTNTSVIVDTFDISAVPQSDGKTAVALVPPEHPARGHDAFTAVRNGYFLAGWYAQRNGESYAQPWDFEKDRLQVPVDGTYSSAEPQLTLYAVWVPLFQVEFVERSTGESLGSYTFDPSAEPRLQVPQWDPETGALEMYQFPERKGFTYQGAYYDAQGQMPVDTGTLTHPGVVDYATGTAKDPSLTVYVDYMPGQWYHIYNADQFLENVNLNGSYILHGDLDFTDKIWPTVLMYGNYTGTIQGNGYSICNVQLAQTNNSKSNAGLFGRLTEEARLEAVTFRNITFTIEAGTRVSGASFGLLAGAIAQEATLTDVVVADSLLQIAAGAYFGTDDYAIGLISGLGGEKLDHSGVACGVTGEADPAIYAVADESGFVTLTDVPPAIPDATEPPEAGE